MYLVCTLQYSTCMSLYLRLLCVYFFYFQAEDGIRDLTVTGVQTCALPILYRAVMKAFMDAKERFRPHLRPADVLAAVRGGEGLEPVEQTEIDSALTQLCEIGRESCRERG